MAKSTDAASGTALIVDGSGKTVYVFNTDSLDDPTCYDVCADTWLPMLAKGNPAGGIVSVQSARREHRGSPVAAGFAGGGAQRR